MRGQSAMVVGGIYAPEHAVHDTCDRVQSLSPATVYRVRLFRQNEAGNFGEEAVVEVERGLGAASWRANDTV